MSIVLKQGPCTACGSSDANTWYSDGHQYCFSCQTYKKSDKIDPKSLLNSVDKPHKVLYTDLKQINRDCVKILEQYDIVRTAPAFKFSDDRDRMVLEIENDNREVIFRTGRTLIGENPKWLHEGEKPYHVFNAFGEGQTVVIVEDPFSALKLARYTPVLCLYGTSIPAMWLKRLKRRFNHILMWLDRDAWLKATKIAPMAKAMGFTYNVLKTEKDPKDMGRPEIEGILHAMLK